MEKIDWIRKPQIFYYLKNKLFKAIFSILYRVRRRVYSSQSVFYFYCHRLNVPFFFHFLRSFVDYVLQTYTYMYTFIWPREQQKLKIDNLFFAPLGHVKIPNWLKVWDHPVLYVCYVCSNCKAVVNMYQSAPSNTMKLLNRCASLVQHLLYRYT